MLYYFDRKIVPTSVRYERPLRAFLAKARSQPFQRKRDLQVTNEAHAGFKVWADLLRRMWILPLFLHFKEQFCSPHSEIHSSFKHFFGLNKSEKEHQAFTQQSYYLDHPALVSLTPPRTNNNQWENGLDQ